MSRRARKSGGKQIDVTVTEVGARGDGLAQHPDTRVPVFVPFSLPGETLRVKLAAEKSGGIDAEPIELLEPSIERIDAPCPHYGSCGGCQLQHWEPQAYQLWQQQRLAYSLIKAGFDKPTLKPLFSVPPASRRRATLAVELDPKGRASIGFRGRASNRLIAISQCGVLRPSLAQAIPKLKAFAEQVIKPNKAAKFHLTETDSGLDLLVHADGEPGPEVYKAGGDLVADLDLARLVWNKEPILTIREPMLRMAGLPVTIPPGAFLQATSESQEAMTQAVLEACPDGISKAMDLYSGLGAFGLALAAKADKVVAVEGLSPATAALDKALRGTPLHPKLDIFTRDLELWPLTAKEMEDADLVVFDPPRAGAKAQAPIIAAAEPKTVIAISCNPATFSRDLVPFQRAGYQLSWAKAFDQFLYSAHLEVMAVLKKP